MTGFIDIHSHILPGIDDGSKNMEMSLEMLKKAENEGISTIFATSHNMPGKGIHSRESIHRRVAELQKAADEEGIKIKIYPGTEYFYREEVINDLEEEKQITFAESDCVLVEFDPMTERAYIRAAAREIIACGFVPVIAHVERYEFLTKQKDYEGIIRLRDIGALIQINTASVTGGMGFWKKLWVRGLLKKELVDFIGTDAHRSEGERSPKFQECAKYVQKKCSKSYADALLGGNAKKYFGI